MKNICLVICFVMLVVNCSATNYYISNAGNDGNNGKAPNKSFKTIDRLNKLKLSPGDSLLFKCGDVFSGQIMVQYSGKEKKPIVYAAYSSGNAPVISGSIEINNWQPYQQNILHSSIFHMCIIFLWMEKCKPMQGSPTKACSKWMAALTMPLLLQITT